LTKVFIFYVVVAAIAFLVPLFVEYRLPDYVYEFRPIAQMIRCVSWGTSVAQMYLFSIVFNLFGPIYVLMKTDLCKVRPTVGRVIFSSFMCSAMLAYFYFVGFVYLHGVRTEKLLAALFCLDPVGSFMVGVFQTGLVFLSITAFYVFCIYPIFFKKRLSK